MCDKEYDGGGAASDDNFNISGSIDLFSIWTGNLQ